MSDLNDFNYTDGVHDVLAAYVNRLLAASFRSEYKNVEVLAADRELTDADTPIQAFDCDGSDRDVLVPVPDTEDNHPFWIVNNSAGANTITIKSNDEVDTLGTVAQGSAILMMPDGAGGYLSVGGPADLSTYVEKTGLTEWDEQAGNPSTPAASKWKLYFKAGGLYYIDDTGAVIGPLSAGGGGGGDKYPVEARLTLETGVAVSTTDLDAQGTVYLTKYRGDQVAVYTGAAWTTLTLGADLSITLSGLTATRPHDIFAYSNSGTLAIEALAWTNDTTRATALSTQNGVLVKSGDATRRYIGTIYLDGSKQCYDSRSKMWVWNYYNRVPKRMYCNDTTNSWTYTTASWRAANNDTAEGVGRVSCVVGVVEDRIAAFNYGLAINSSVVRAAVGVGINSTSANSAQTFGAHLITTAAQAFVGTFMGFLAVGFNYIQRLEYSTATGTCTWYGDQGGSVMQSGMHVDLMG